jgi:hypothetical protein
MGSFSGWSNKKEKINLKSERSTCVPRINIEWIMSFQGKIKCPARNLPGIL